MHEELTPSTAERHSSQDILQAACGKGPAESRAFSSKPGPTWLPSAVFPRESTPRAEAAQPIRPASCAPSSRPWKQIAVDPLGACVLRLRGHSQDRRTHLQPGRAAGRSFRRGCCGSFATFLVTIARENPIDKWYSCGSESARGGTHARFSKISWLCSHKRL